MCCSSPNCPPEASGTGLAGHYHSDTSFSTLELTRTDSLIDFNWGGGSPDALLPDDDLSIRWTGIITPLVTGRHGLMIHSDGAVKLWLDDTLLIDDADADAGPLPAAGVDLVGGQGYAIILDYTHTTGDAWMLLRWAAAELGHYAIQTSQLDPVFGMLPPTGSPTPTPTSTATATPTATPTATATATPTPTPPIVMSSRVISYTYDGLQRLTGATETWPTTTSAYSYTYDLAGNRLEAWQDGSLQQNRSYNNANQVVGWTYDAVGNLLSDGTTTRSYDALNRVITQAGVTNGYNGDGVLVRSGTTNYTQDLASPLSQILSDGTNQYVYGLERLYGVQGSARTWYLSNRLGSIRSSINSTGTVAGVATYDPYGQVQGSPLFGVPFGFTGELQQGSSIYLRTRWYSPGTGTFSSRDTFSGNDFQPNSLHPYQYGLNNPILFIDPTGQHPCLTALIGGPPGAVVSAGCIVIVTAVALTLGASAAIIDACIYRSQCNGLQAFLQQQGDSVTRAYVTVNTNAPIGARFVGEVISQACTSTFETIVAFAKGGKEKGESYVTKWAKEEAQRSGKDVCDILRAAKAAAAAAGDRKLYDDIIQAEKFLGCRNRKKRSSG